jgi:hypothetical protein
MASPAPQRRERAVEVSSVTKPIAVKRRTSRRLRLRAEKRSSSRARSSTSWPRCSHGASTARAADDRQRSARVACSISSARFLEPACVASRPRESASSKPRLRRPKVAGSAGWRPSTTTA